MFRILTAFVVLLGVGCGDRPTNRTTDDRQVPVIEGSEESNPYLRLHLVSPDLGLSPDFSIWLIDRTHSTLKKRIFLDANNMFQISTSELSEGSEYSFHFMNHEGRPLGTWDWSLSVEGLQYQVRYVGSGEGFEFPDVSLLWSDTGWVVLNDTLGVETSLFVVGSAQALSNNMFPTVDLPGAISTIRFGGDVLVESSQDILELYMGSDFAKSEALKRSKRVFVQVLGEGLVAAKMIFSGQWWSRARFISREKSRLLEFGSFDQTSLTKGMFGFSGSWIVGKYPQQNEHVIVNIQTESGESFDYPIAYAEQWSSIPKIISLSSEKSYTPVYGETVMDGLTQAFAVTRSVENLLLEIQPPQHFEEGELSFAHENVEKIHVFPEFYERQDSGSLIKLTPSVSEYDGIWVSDVATTLGYWRAAEHQYEVKTVSSVGGYDVLQIPVGIFSTRAKTSVKVRVVYETVYGLISTLFWIDFP
ncbi:MAG: hypothetical protein AB8C84_11440 [Oligoflexales bacterium]